MNDLCETDESGLAPPPLAPRHIVFLLVGCREVDSLLSLSPLVISFLPLCLCLRHESDGSLFLHHPRRDCSVTLRSYSGVVVLSAGGEQAGNG
jgi:hypothetical protein